MHLISHQSALVGCSPRLGPRRAGNAGSEAWIGLMSHSPHSSRRELWGLKFC